MTETSLTCRAFGVETRAVREAERTVDVIMSTDAVDSYGERVAQDGWDLSRFSRNPVVIAFHDARSLPIGRAERVRVEDDKLQCTIRFATAAANPMAEHCFQLFKEGVLNAVSVGFIPTETRWEKFNGEDIHVLAKNILLELSVVCIPANPEALAKMRARARETATTKERAVSRVTENVMDLEKELSATREKLTAAESAKAVAEAKLGIAEQRATTLEKSVYDLTADRDAQLVALKSVTAERDAAVAARDEAITQLAAAEKSIIERDVEALVGVKFTREEKGPMLELALSNKNVFDKVVEARPDLKVLGGPKLPVAKLAPSSAAGVDNGDELAALIEASAEA